MKLTVIVLTHNDEMRIVDCLERLNFADEILILDDNSIDRTLELCVKFTKNIHKRNLNGNFSSQRNFALNFAKSDWVMFVDSDEYVSDELRKEILAAIEKKEFNGYFVRRIDRMWGKEILHGEVGQVKLLRLAKRKSGKWYGKVHETWNVSGRKTELENPLVHIPHSNVKEFLSDIEGYSTLRAEELYERGVKSSAASIVLYPAVKFFQNYFLKRGYKDGLAGFVYAMMMSFHSFLVRGKLFILSA